jgi:hypothetical protein
MAAGTNENTTDLLNHRVAGGLGAAAAQRWEVRIDCHRDVRPAAVGWRHQGDDPACLAEPRNVSGTPRPAAG